MLAKAKKKELVNMLMSMSTAYARSITHISEQAGISDHDYKLKDGEKCYGFIPHHSYYEILHGLTTIFRLIEHSARNKPRFLDIGCGIGNIVLLAQMSDYAADGLEYDLRTYKAAKQFCSDTAARIFRGDMRTFGKYGDYDVLYYYQPMCEHGPMTEFSHKLAKDTKPGAYILCHGNAEGLRESKEFSFLNDHIWRKRKK